MNVKSVSVSEWKSIMAPRPLASSPTSHLTPAGSSVSSDRGYRAVTGPLLLQTSHGWSRPCLCMDAAEPSDMRLDTMPGRGHTAGERGPKLPWTS